MDSLPEQAPLQIQEKAKKYNPLLILALIAVLIGAWVVAYAYATTSVRTGAPPAVTFAGQTALPAQSAWSEPVLGGLLTKSYTEDTPGENRNLGILETKTLLLEIDGEVRTDLTISSENGVVFEGTADDYGEFSFTENGEYSALLKISSPATLKQSNAELTYKFSFELNVEPKILFSSDRALQGDILAVYVNTGFEEAAPKIETDLGVPVFLPLSADEYISYVPVNHAQNLGK